VFKQQQKLQLFLFFYFKKMGKNIKYVYNKKEEKMQPIKKTN
jgi:hypothetical protein